MLRQVQSDRSNLAHGWLPFAADSITAVWHSDAARGPSTPSFDHLVDARQEGGRYCQSERLGGRRAATPPRRRAWLRSFVVGCSLPCDPPVGGHSCNGGTIPRFERAVCDYFTLGARAAMLTARSLSRRLILPRNGRGRCADRLFSPTPITISSM